MSSSQGEAATSLATATEAGRVEEARRLCTLLLEQRFGFLSPQVHWRVEDASREQVETWILRLAGAGGVDDVFGG